MSFWKLGSNRSRIEKLEARVRELESKTADFGGGYGNEIWWGMNNAIWARLSRTESSKETMTVREVVQKILDHLGLEIKRRSTSIDVAAKPKAKK